jgi:hypothetical protein
MTEVINEPMYELLKRMQSDRTQMNAIRDHIATQSKDISNIYSKLVGHELRLERIDHRLDLIGEPAE